jgi:CheY-like chemotaxis protein
MLAARGRFLAKRGQCGIGAPCAVMLAVMSRTIAIVEDEPAIRANYAEALRRYGYAVAAYDNRSDALAAFAQRLPDLVLIDVGLGEEIEGGFDLCRDLRARSSSLPILFLTARDFRSASGCRRLPEQIDQLAATHRPRTGAVSPA